MAMIGGKFKPGTSDVQRPLDQQSLRAETTQNQDAVPTREINSSWSAVADDLFPDLLQVVNSAMSEAIGVGACSEREVARIVARQSVRWSLPPQLFHTVTGFITACCEQVHESPNAIEDFLHQFGPRRHPAAYYEVFHHGRVDMYCDDLPADILNLKDHVMFWIDHSQNGMQSYHQRLGRDEGLQPKAEAMLRFLCRIEHAGQTVPLTDLATAVWGPEGLPAIGSIRNNINVQQNAINMFAVGKFIVVSRCRSQPNEKTIVRLWGEDAYMIGTRVHEELCIITSIGCP